MSLVRSSACCLMALLLGCGAKYTLPDLDGDGLTGADGDCWDAPEGPVEGGPEGADIHPGADETWYDGVDQDCDGASDFDQDADGQDAAAFGGADCDDLDDLVFTGAEETPYDGVDQDCDGADLDDQDGDGYAATQAGGADCDDLNPEIFPGAAETWYNGVDEDCAGDDDYDQDADGSPVDEDCDDLDPDRYPGVHIDEIWYNGFDEDCDGNDGDKDGDGYVPDGYAAAIDWTAFPAHVGAGDCWDDPDDPPLGLTPLNGFPELLAPDFSPGAEETWYDGLDQDCARDNDFDQDGDGYDTSAYENGLGERGEDCIDGSDRDVPNPGGVPPAEAHPGAADAWYDGTDADCAGDDDYDQDGDGFTSSAYSSGSADDCDDLSAEVNPDATERCDTAGVDDDCSGTDNDPDALGCGALYLDMDGDGYGLDESLCLCDVDGDYRAAVSGDCDDAVATTSPDGAEVCDDADADEDCDGLADDDDPSATGYFTGYVDGDADGYGSPDAEVVACDLPPDAVASPDDCDDADAAINPDADEVCDTGRVDEDCDGLIDDADPGVTGTSAWYADRDSDTYGDPSVEAEACEQPSGYVADRTDCDDTYAEINPGATERCDAADTDEDCDGLADDLDSSSTGKSTFYVDADSDGYGDAGTTARRCDLSPGYSADSTDCDDTRASVHPGATEVCDTLDTDEDCDGLADDADPDATGTSPWYLDEDADGYGGTTTTYACDLPRDHTSTDGDCDDLDATSFPGAEERCGDGVVNDCSGAAEDALAECRLDGGLGEGDVAALRTGTTRRDGLGQQLANAGDVDGDGVPDLLVSAPSASLGEDVGAVYLMSGLWATGEARAASDAVFLIKGGTTGDRAGAGLAGGDAAGDGLSDLLIGAPGEDAASEDAGAVFWFEGPLSGGVVLDVDTGAIDATVYGAATGDGLGEAVALLDDLDGDGYPELLLGAPGVGASVEGGGAAYVVRGPPSSGADLADALAALYGESASDAAGQTLAAAGDVDGDGVGDALVGAPQADGAGGDAGLAALFFGAPSGDLGLSDADLRVSGGAGGDLLGAGLSAGVDLDGDGYDDLLLGAPETDGRGAAIVLLGSASAGGAVSAGAADATLKGSGAGDRAGAAVSGRADVDGDGAPDLLIGAPGWSVADDTSAGAAYLVYGPFSGTMDLADADAMLLGGMAAEGLGQAVLGVPDLSGDGVDELLVGAPGRDSADGNKAGAALLLLGSGY